MTKLGNPNIENRMLGGMTLFQDMTWTVFETTGNIEAYLAYKQFDQTPMNQQEKDFLIKKRSRQ